MQNFISRNVPRNVTSARLAEEAELELDLWSAASGRLRQAAPFGLRPSLRTSGGNLCLVRQGRLYEVDGATSRGMKSNSIKGRSRLEEVGSKRQKLQKNRNKK